MRTTLFLNLILMLSDPIFLLKRIKLIIHLYYIYVTKKARILLHIYVINIFVILVLKIQFRINKIPLPKQKRKIININNTKI